MRAHLGGNRKVIRLIKSKSIRNMSAWNGDRLTGRPRRLVLRPGGPLRTLSNFLVLYSLTVLSRSVWHSFIKETMPL